MPNKEEEILAVKIVRDYLKEEKNIHIKRIRPLTEKNGEPPDCYFEMEDRKIGCEVERFDPDPKGKGINLAKESGIKRTIGKRAVQSLQEKGIPVVVLSFDFTPPPTEVHKNAEKIVKIITIMHNDSITDSTEYMRNNREKYYELFLENNIDHISFLYRDQLYSKNIDETRLSLLYHIPTRPEKTIAVEEMQKVITCKNKDIPRYKKCYDYDQKWLIITNHETIDFFILKGAAKETEYKCNFDRVFYTQMRWIDKTTGKQKWTGSRTDIFTVHELKVKR